MLYEVITVSVALDGSDPDVEVGARVGPSASFVPVANNVLAHVAHLNRNNLG